MCTLILFLPVFAKAENTSASFPTGTFSKSSEDTLIPPSTGKAMDKLSIQPFELDGDKRYFVSFYYSSFATKHYSCNFSGIFQADNNTLKQIRDYAPQGCNDLILTTDKQYIYINSKSCRQFCTQSYSIETAYPIHTNKWRK